MCFPIKFDGSAPLSHISVCFAAHQTAQYSPSIVGSRLYDAKSFQMTVVVSWRYNNRTEVTPNNWLYWLQRPVTFVFPPVHFMVLFFVLFFWCVFVFFSWRMNLWFIGLHLSSRSFAMVSEPGCDTIKMEGRKKGRRWRRSDRSMHSSASIPSAAITPYRLYKHYANVCAAVQCAIMWCWR